MSAFIGPQLPPDDILYRRAPKLSREVFRHRRIDLQDWLKERMKSQPQRYNYDYYVKLGDSDLVLDVEMYLTISYGNNQEGEDA